MRTEGGDFMDAAKIVLGVMTVICCQMTTERKSTGSREPVLF